MPSLVRGAMFLAGFAAVVCLVYVLKPTPQPTSASETKPTIVLNMPPVPTPASTVPAVTKIEPEPEFVIPLPGREAAAEPVSKNDPNYLAIQKHLGIKTTLDDGPAASPVVRTGAEGSALPRQPDVAYQPAPPQPVPPNASFVPAASTAVNQLPPPPAAPESPRIDPTPPAPEPMPLPDAVPPAPVLDPRMPDLAPAKPVTTPAKVILNTRAVSFNFEVTKVGPSKVKAVELWATRDGGKTWEKYDRMVGDKPPFKTYLGGEGDFGFQLVVESESGQRTPKPSGLAGAVMVEVDTTPPQVSELTLQGASPGHVRLDWQADDKNLDELRTQVEYSADGRTWRPIPSGANHLRKKFVAASPGVQAVGFFHHFVDWKLPDGLPHQLHFRVTAVDKAGNEGSATIPDRLSIDLVAPEGKLTGVAPQRAAETGPMPRVVNDPQIFSFYLGLMSAAPRPAGSAELVAADLRLDPIEFPCIERAPDCGVNPVLFVREWVVAVTGSDGRPTESTVPSSDQHPRPMPDEMDRLVYLLGAPFKDLDTKPADQRIWEQWAGDERCYYFRQYKLEAYFSLEHYRGWRIGPCRFPTETRAHRERLEYGRRTADTMTGGQTMLSQVLDETWKPSTHQAGEKAAMPPVVGDRQVFSFGMIGSSIGWPSDH